MTFLRFSPDEYQILTRLCDPLDLDRKPLHAFKKILIRALADVLPKLAGRIIDLRRSELRILQEHFRDCRRGAAGHGLSAAEVSQIVEVSGSFLFHVRFIGPLRRSLVQFFRESAPQLAAKLDRLPQGHFETLCAQVREQSREGA